MLTIVNDRSAPSKPHVPAHISIYFAEIAQKPLPLPPRAHPSLRSRSKGQRPRLLDGFLCDMPLHRYRDVLTGIPGSGNWGIWPHAVCIGRLKSLLGIQNQPRYRSWTWGRRGRRVSASVLPEEWPRFLLPISGSSELLWKEEALGLSSPSPITANGAVIAAGDGKLARVSIVQTDKEPWSYSHICTRQATLSVVTIVKPPLRRMPPPIFLSISQK